MRGSLRGSTGLASAALNLRSSLPQANHGCRSAEFARSSPPRGSTVLRPWPRRLLFHKRPSVAVRGHQPFKAPANNPQTSETTPKTSTPGRDRTCDLRFRKPSLYPLSYGSKCVFPRKNKGFRFGILGKGEATNKDSPNAPQTGPPWEGMAAGRRASSARLLPLAIALIPESRQQRLPVGFGHCADPFQDGVQFGQARAAGARWAGEDAYPRH